MSSDDMARALVMARLLVTHRVVLALNLTLLVFVFLTPSWLNLAFVLLFFYVIYLHIGLEFDALVFADFASGELEPSKFDSVLEWLNLKSNLPTSRTLESRCKGAMTKFKQLLIISVILAPSWAVLAKFN